MYGSHQAVLSRVEKNPQTDKDFFSKTLGVEIYRFRVLTMNAYCSLHIVRCVLILKQCVWNPGSASTCKQDPQTDKDFFSKDLGVQTYRFQVLTMNTYCSMHIVRRVLILKLDGSLWLNIILRHLMTREAALQVPGWAPEQALFC